MNSNIDVMTLAKEIENKNMESYVNDMEEFIEQFKEQSTNQSMDINEFIKKFISPFLGLRFAHHTHFTIELIQKVVDEINSEKK